MNKNKYLCSTCKTGMESYFLDSRTSMCPYIQYSNGDICPFYVSIRQSLIKRLISKLAKK